MQSRGFLSALGFLVIVSLSGSAFAQTPDACIDEARYEKILKVDYKWSVQKNAKGVPVTGFDRCDVKSVSYKVIAAYIKLQDFPAFDSKVDDANRNVVGSSPAGFIKSRVKAFIFDAEDSKVCVTGQVAAYVSRGEDIAHICPQAVSNSDLDIMDTLIHESRHVEGFPHAQCTRGSRQNAQFLACDESYEDGGSYGVGAEFNVRLSRTVAVPTAVRAQARANGLIAFMTSFNKLPLELQEGVFAQTPARELYFVGDSSATSLTKKAPEGLLVSRGGVPTWYDGVTGQVVSRGAGDVMTDTEGIFAKNFRTAMPPARRQSLVDIKYGSYSCMLFDKDMSCGPDLTETYLMDLEGQKATGFIIIGSRQALRMENGDIYALPAEYVDIKGKKLSDFKKVPMSKDILQFLSSDSRSAMALTSDGVLLRTEALTAPLTEVPHTRQLRFERIVGPSMWSQRAESL